MRSIIVPLELTVRPWRRGTFPDCCKEASDSFCPEFLRRFSRVAMDWMWAFMGAPRRFVWKPTATIGGGRSAVWACGQVAERLVHMPMRPCSA
jgi:hypothetical protein